MSRWLAGCVARYLEGFAGRVDGEYPGPHVPGTLGAEWAKFAALCRKLAAELRSR
jgi:hypothetical protein